jgi:hypothetical protein
LGIKRFWPGDKLIVEMGLQEFIQASHLVSKVIAQVPRDSKSEHGEGF